MASSDGASEASPGAWRDSCSVHSEDSSLPKIAESPVDAPAAERIHGSPLTPHLARQVAKMSIAHPEVLRVTLVHKALRRCGDAFRCDGDMHHLSERSEGISRFWSHSWHGSQWQKVLTLMVLYNGFPSMLLGTCAAFIVMSLFSVGLLPGFVRGVPGAQWFFSTWSLAIGFLVAIATFFFWKPRQEVFFDRICISEDPKLKALAIFSLAGMLKKSREMLVLWDPSWSDRLWCLFELAAFLKSENDQERQSALIMMPTFLGLCSTAVFLTVSAAMLGVTTLPIGGESASLVPFSGLLVFGALVGFFALMAFRGYFHSVDILDKKLGSASFDKVICHCCECNHLSETGQRIECDREVLKQCVTIWFGSTTAFEESCRSELRAIVVKELCQDVFTRGWALQVSLPILWAFMDIVATFLRIAYYDVAFEFFATGLVVWLGFAPILCDLVVFLTRRYCQAQQWDFFWKLWLELPMVLLVAGLGGLHALLRILLPLGAWSHALGRSGAFAGSILILGVLVEVLKSTTGCQVSRSQGPAPASHESDDIDETSTRPSHIISL